MKNTIVTIFVATALLLATSTGCRKRTNSEDEAPDTSTYHPEATPATQFERDLKYVRDAHFAYVWIFSRKDGKEFTKEDSGALRTNRSEERRVGKEWSRHGSSRCGRRG